MKNYYIRKIELVQSSEHGKLLKVIASQFSKPCPEDQTRKCERLGYAYCPTFVMRYTKYLYMTLNYQKKNWEPMTINSREFVIEKHPLGENLPTKIYYVHSSLVSTGIWQSLRARLTKYK